MTKRLNIGSVSHGTMCPEDLIPAFLDELRAQPDLTAVHQTLINEIEIRMEAEDYFDSEESYWDLHESLFDALNEYAPTGFYFGAHPGDGSDYGFWLSESFVEDFDGLKVSDLSEVPTNHTGEVLLVNDHGNMSLYAYSRGKRRELWSIV